MKVKNFYISTSVDNYATCPEPYFNGAFPKILWFSEEIIFKDFHGNYVTFQDILVQCNEYGLQYCTPKIVLVDIGHIQLRSSAKTSRPGQANQRHAFRFLLSVSVSDLG